MSVALLRSCWRHYAVLCFVSRLLSGWQDSWQIVLRTVVHHVGGCKAPPDPCHGHAHSRICSPEWLWNGSTLVYVMVTRSSTELVIVQFTYVHVYKEYDCCAVVGRCDVCPLVGTQLELGCIMALGIQRCWCVVNDSDILYFVTMYHYVRARDEGMAYDPVWSSCWPRRLMAVRTCLDEAKDELHQYNKSLK